MATSNQSMNHLIQTLGRLVDRELDSWMSFIPVDELQIASFELRPEIVAWLASRNQKFGFNLETLFLAVDIFDRFLRCVRVQTKYLRCIAVTCLYLAAKIKEEDEVIPSTCELVRRSECGCSVAEVLRMERCIVTKLNWNLAPSPTSIEFINLFDAMVLKKCPTLTVASPPNTPRLDALHLALLLCLPHTDITQYAPSTLALAAHSLYLQLTWVHWLPATHTLQAFTQVSDDELTACRELVSRHVGCRLLDVVRNNNNNKVTAASSTASPPTVTSPSPVIFSCDKEQPTEEHLPPSLPVTPDPPAKRRRIDEEDDDDVYADIGRLYAEDVPPSLPRWYTSRPVTARLTYAAVLMSSCATQALQRVGGVSSSLTLPIVTG